MTWLDGQAVIITGSGQGLGRAFALDAASRGAAVVVNDVDHELADATADLIRQSGGHAATHYGSVSQPDTGDELVDLCVREFSRCDGLVNNAGQFVWQDSGTEDPARVRAMIETNLLGAVFCGSAALRHFASTAGATIVNVSSRAYLGLERMAAYAATKGALVSLTYSWASEFAGIGIRVNCLVPRAATRMSALRNDIAEFPDPSRIAPVMSMLLSESCVTTTGNVVGFDGKRLSLLGRPATDVIATVGPSDDVDTLMPLLQNALGEALS